MVCSLQAPLTSSLGFHFHPARLATAERKNSGAETPLVHLRPPPSLLKPENARGGGMHTTQVCTLATRDKRMFVDHVVLPWDVDRGRKVAMPSIGTCQ